MSRPRHWSLALVCVCVGLAGCGGSSAVGTATDAEPSLQIDPQPGLTAMAPPRVAAGDWPWWRGPRRDNCAPNEAAPTKWSETDGVLWKVAISGQGHSTPILVGDLVVLTTGDEATQEQSIIALDRRTGDRRWQTVVHHGGLMLKNSTNTHASATPAYDGERVFVVFLNRDALQLSALDLAGKILWQTAVGPFTSEHGGGPSPVLYGSLVLVNGDNPRTGFVAGVHRQSGKIAWRQSRPATVGNYVTPTVAELAGRPQLLLSGNGHVDSYDPDTGRIWWTCQGPPITADTVVVGGELVFATGDTPRQLLAIRPNGAGDVTNTHFAWRSDRAGDLPSIPSMLWHDGFLFVVTEKGIAVCFEAANGKIRWRQRLNGAFWSSPVLFGNHIYAANQEGETFVFEPNPDRFVLTAKNQLSEGTSASPVVGDGRVYLRTTGYLYCIGN